ncbi:hypothetical protein EK21DRAFT_111205 [Setomelanomma holmii]|uniref:Uncharacterized protein n=1 Tax=Setomelanomma holmii TaxID=210430 RepID=A0A9P4HA60_9PLEO|nr:hypothetical protein EK21DRAFT_111205 [Setomelanomma holmii]
MPESFLSRFIRKPKSPPVAGLDRDPGQDAGKLLEVDLSIIETKRWSAYQLRKYSKLRQDIFNNKDQNTIKGPNIDGTEVNIWRRNGPLDDTMEIQYMTAAEMHPDLHTKVPLSEKLKDLYAISDVDKDQVERGNFLIISPVVIKSWHKHEDRALESTQDGKGTVESSGRTSERKDLMRGLRQIVPGKSDSTPMNQNMRKWRSA